MALKAKGGLCQVDRLVDVEVLRELIEKSAEIIRAVGVVTGDAVPLPNRHMLLWIRVQDGGHVRQLLPGLVHYRLVVTTQTVSEKRLGNQFRVSGEVRLMTIIAFPLLIQRPVNVARALNNSLYVLLALEAQRPTRPLYVRNVFRLMRIMAETAVLEHRLVDVPSPAQLACHVIVAEEAELLPLLCQQFGLP